MSVPAQSCATCLKPQHLCVCEAVEPIDNRVFVLILEHPQEKRETLGTAQLTHLQLKNSMVRVGLSWSNLKRILGREVDYKRWAVLYLGTAKQGEAAPREEIAVVDKAGKPVPGGPEILEGLEGIILLDGTWAQAKTLWWRNPWLLKCRRIILHPRFRSLYGEARREPRRESVSTLEAAAFLLSRLEGDQTVYDRMLKPFALLLKKMRAPRPRPQPVIPAPEAPAPEAEPS
jgi:DTW domain-containing protein YfiP